ncbi:hypothetical protein Ancab_024169, partial [Ancistrocladus abbreviatus]
MKLELIDVRLKLATRKSIKDGSTSTMGVPKVKNIEMSLVRENKRRTLEYFLYEGLHLVKECSQKERLIQGCTNMKKAHGMALTQ